jgi:hypothetical protein
MKKITLPAFLFFFFLHSPGQTGRLRLGPELRLLPGDTVLVTSLRGWLGAMGGPDSLNGYVAEADRPAMAVLMDQLRRLKGECWLGGVMPLDSAHLQIQLNYMSVFRDTPFTQACCTVLARREGDRWFVSSPLAAHTVNWKQRTIGCCTFHYPENINFRQAAEFERLVASYDQRLKIGKPVIDFYCCGNFMEASKLVGIDYMAIFSGFGYSDLSGEYGSRQVIVCGNEWKDGFCTISMHDMWHGELHRAVSTKVINRPVDEGMAYLYGGSWIIYSWKDILKMMKDYRATHVDADWLMLYKGGTDLVPAPKVIKISYAVNALIVQRLEKERGFAASLPLLCCGPKEAGDSNYFAALKTVTGVDEAHFNAYIDGLVKDALY